MLSRCMKEKVLENKSIASSEVRTAIAFETACISSWRVAKRSSYSLEVKAHFSFKFTKLLICSQGFHGFLFVCFSCSFLFLGGGKLPCLCGHLLLRCSNLSLLGSFQFFICCLALLF